MAEAGREAFLTALLLAACPLHGKAARPKGWFKSFDGGYACRSHTGRPTSARSACQGRRDSCGDRQSDGSMTKDSMTSSIRMLPSYLSKRLQVAARHGPQKSLTNAAHFGDRCVLLFAHSCGMRRISQEMSWWRSDRRMGRRVRFVHVCFERRLADPERTSRA